LRVKVLTHRRFRGFAADALQFREVDDMAHWLSDLRISGFSTSSSCGCNGPPNVSTVCQMRFVRDHLGELLLAEFPAAGDAAFRIGWIHVRRQGLVLWLILRDHNRLLRKFDQLHD
jgi:hypothetical protein